MFFYEGGWRLWGLLRRQSMMLCSVGEHALARVSSWQPGDALVRSTESTDPATAVMFMFAKLWSKVCFLALYRFLLYLLDILVWLWMFIYKPFQVLPLIVAGGFSNNDREWWVNCSVVSATEHIHSWCDHCSRGGRRVWLRVTNQQITAAWCQCTQKPCLATSGSWSCCPSSTNTSCTEASECGLDADDIGSMTQGLVSEFWVVAIRRRCCRQILFVSGVFYPLKILIESSSFFLDVGRVLVFFRAISAMFRSHSIAFLWCTSNTGKMLNLLVCSIRKLRR